MSEVSKSDRLFAGFLQAREGNIRDAAIVDELHTLPALRYTGAGGWGSVPKPRVNAKAGLGLWRPWLHEAVCYTRIDGWKKLDEPFRMEQIPAF